MDMKIHEIQEEINQLMQSKIAKFSDKKLETFEKLKPGGKDNSGSINQRKQIDQFDLDGNYIMTFVSVTQASKTIKRDRSSIIKCLNGETKQSGGFIWKYKN